MNKETRARYQHNFQRGAYLANTIKQAQEFMDRDLVEDRLDVQAYLKQHRIRLEMLEQLD